MWLELGLGLWLGLGLGSGLGLGLGLGATARVARAARLVHGEEGLARARLAQEGDALG